MWNQVPLREILEPQIPMMKHSFIHEPIVNSLTFKLYADPTARQIYSISVSKQAFQWARFNAPTHLSQWMIITNPN